MDERTIIYVIIGVFGAIIGVYIWVAKHISNSKKHPCGEKLVYKDVCEANRDCIEGSIESLKELINTKFAHIEELIKSGR